MKEGMKKGEIERTTNLGTSSRGLDSRMPRLQLLRPEDHVSKKKGGEKEEEERKGEKGEREENGKRESKTLLYLS